MIDRAGEVLAQLKRGYNRRRPRLRDREVEVQLYRGYRSSERLWVQGRVLEADGISAAATDSRWRNMVNALRRFESDEIAGARVRMRYRGREEVLTADHEGYVTWDAPVHGLGRGDDEWEYVEAELVDLPYGRAAATSFRGEVADLTRDARYAVVTDIDDTVLKTYITSPLKLRALYHTLVDNAHTRLPFAGAAELFAGLHEGPEPGGDAANPVFYLSRSPWNLYRMLERFLDGRGFPRGPIFLRDVGLRAAGIPAEGHKRGTLLRLLSDFPRLRFVLVGDSGERDADIYRQVESEHPDRVAAVVIRNVKNNANAQRIRRMFERRETPPKYFLVRDSAEAAERLRALGLLSEAQVASVAAAEQVG